MLREQFLKGIADELPMKEEFDAWSDFCATRQQKWATLGMETTLRIVSLLLSPTSAVPRSRRQSAAAVLMPDMSAAAKTFNLNQEEDLVVAQRQETPATAEVVDVACPYHISSREMPPLLSDRAVDEEKYKDSE